jgi:subtilisin family serine protease
MLNVSENSEVVSNSVMAFLRRLWFAILATLLVLSLSQILRTHFCRRYATITGRTISFSVWPNWFNLLFLPATDSWYFVHFYNPPDDLALRASGITVDFWRPITSTVYALYLSPDNASFLLRSKLAELAPVEDKMIDSEVSPSEADFLIIEAAPVFDVNDFPSIRFKPMIGGHYMARSEDLKQTVAVLSKCRSVYAITPAKDMVPLNRFASGYSQLNTKIPDHDGNMERYLQSKGLNGSGIVVTIIDSYLDRNSTFFADPKVPIQNTIYSPTHRKVVYNDWDPDIVMNTGEHGTHVAGIVAGSPLQPDLMKYAGVAPAAKIALQTVCAANFMDQLWNAPGIMDQIGSHIHSNSWGGTFKGKFTADWRLNSLAHQHSDKLFIFAVGNDGTGNSSIGTYFEVNSPGSAKNILTVGALSLLQVSASPSHDFWINVCWIRRHGNVSVTVPATWYQSSSDPFVAEQYLLLGQATTYLNLSYSSPSVVFVSTGGDLNFLHNALQLPVAAVSSSPITTTTVFRFPVFECRSALLWSLVAKSMANDDTLLITIGRATRPDAGVGASVAHFSSKGPTRVGIMKPDVVAPGTNIISAQSDPGIDTGNFPKEMRLKMMSGSSMATANVAGIVALIEQYFKDGLHNGIAFVPSGTLMRVIVIMAADPLTPGDKTINAESGFGQVNLGKYLPFSGDRFCLLIGDFISIWPGGHVVALFSVINKSHEVRVAIAYIDDPGDSDSLFPLVCDLDLIIVSPTGRVFRGNRRPDDTEERFSTNERVIIDPAELELGTYEVHVIAAHLAPTPITNFSIAAVGAITTANQYFAFAPATDCATGCGNGICDSANLTCSCPVDRVGQSCQTSIEVYQGSASPIEFEVPPFGLKWLALDELGSHKRYRLSTEKSGGRFQIYTARGNSHAIPNDYEVVESINYSVPTIYKKTMSFDGNMSVLIRNDSSDGQKFFLLVEKDITIFTKAVFAILVVVVTVVIAGIVFCSLGNRRVAGYPAAFQLHPFHT